MYLNQVYFGKAPGVLKKRPINILEKTWKIWTYPNRQLWRLVNSPNALDPYRHYNRAIHRRNVVLFAMKEYGMITKSQYEQAKAKSLR